MACVLTCLVGCSRRAYRLWADRDAYHLIDSRQIDPNWELPRRRVEPSERSRLADYTNQDCGPKPRDDPTANRWTRQPYKFCNNRYWDRISDGPPIDQGHWQAYLPIEESGKIELTRQRAIELALLHSREYQDRIEAVYLSALALSENRFEFETQWFGGTSTTYDAAGKLPLGNRTLTQSHLLGLTRSLAAGGELAASLANTWVWQLDSSGVHAVGSSIALGLTQPLLRGAFRHVRLESLTQAERNLLYDVRDFARFRRQFYFQITNAYLNLLTISQGLRNQLANLESLELNLQEHRELFARQRVTQIQVDEVFQNYQSGKIAVLAFEQSLADSLDDFKFLLGLPPGVDIDLNEEYLRPFELSDPRLDQLQKDAEQVYQALIQFLPPETPPRDVLLETHRNYVEKRALLVQLMPGIQEELAKWRQKLERESANIVSEEDEIDNQQQRQLIDRVSEVLNEIHTELQEDIDGTDDFVRQLNDLPPVDAWSLLSRRIGRRFREQISGLFIAQNRIRLFLIEVIPFEIEEEAAVELALASRLDLMNDRAEVSDAFRALEVVADSLESDLTFTADANIRTDPDRLNPLRFDSSANSYRLGVQFDGPLNRFSERNRYRSAQINYQRVRRTYMAREDTLINSIRADLRSIRISWLNFQIARQRLIAATRQVDEAQFNLRTATSGDSSLTQDLLSALQSLLQAKNSLISSWINYESVRIQLFVDLELLYLDADGNWINERFNPGRSLGDGRSGDLNSDPNQTGRPSGDPPSSDSGAGDEQSGFRDYFHSGTGDGDHVELGIEPAR